MTRIRRIFWNEQQWNAVLGTLHQLQQERPQLSDRAALLIAQEVLPFNQRRPSNGLFKSLMNGQLDRERERWRKTQTHPQANHVMPKAPLPPLPPLPLDLPDVVGLNMIHWTFEEWHNIARWVKTRIIGGDTTSIYKLVDHAQRVLLPHARWRSTSALRSNSGKTKARYQELALAIDPAALFPLEPPELEPPLVDAAPPEPQAAPQALDAQPAPLPLPEASTAPPAPSVPVAPAEPFAQAVGHILAGAMQDVMQLYSTRVAEILDQRLGALMAQVQEEVHRSLEQELGGPVAAPDAPAAPAVPAPAGQRLQIDVLGLKGHAFDEVRRHCNGGADVRFVTGGDRNLRFRSTVVVAGWHLAPELSMHVHRDASNVVRVHGGSAAVIEAIQKLQQEGASHARH